MADDGSATDVAATEVSAGQRRENSVGLLAGNLPLAFSDIECSTRAGVVVDASLFMGATMEIGAGWRGGVVSRLIIEYFSLVIPDFVGAGRAEVVDVAEERAG